MQIGYCGNVHPGRTIEEVKRNLTEYSLSVKQQFRPAAEMGIGLWLSATAAAELGDLDTVSRFRDWLSDAGLLPFTLNGFPFGDFHQDVVKHEVYQPTWAEPARLNYTLQLAEIQNQLLPDGVEGTISTLPLGWPGRPGGANDAGFMKACADNLRQCARSLADLKQATGRSVFVCIEPEPGCLIDTCDDLVHFYRTYLLTDSDTFNDTIFDHIGVCHDVCHSAVMFEDQSVALGSYREAGIRVGKIQVSSAIKVEFGRQSTAEKNRSIQQLRTFAEPRYLHQTSVRLGAEQKFFEDLPLALDSVSDQPAGQWRVHFHVPIFSESLDLIGTTQSEIRKCLDAIQTGDRTTHFEVETYAWNVLPERLREDRLADGIAKELRWFESQLS